MYNTVSNWNIEEVEENLNQAFENDSEVELLDILKNNSFLFYELYSRKYGIQPNFKEISFGGEYRCDFAWLNDNSDGPEWVLVEIEKPKMKLFTKKNEPGSALNHAMEQVKSWERYFNENPNEKKRIFGAVSSFRYILVAGSTEEWSTDHAIKWRQHHNSESKIEIRSTNVFYKALSLFKTHEDEFWSFKNNPISKSNSELREYWENYGYMDIFRRLAN